MHKKITVVFLTSYISLASATAINGPTTISEDALAVMTANVDSKSSVLWDIAPADIASVYEGGNVFVVTGPPGRYQLTLTEIGPSGDEGKPFRLTRVRSTLVILPRNSPTPGPPSPNPIPPTPEPTGWRAWSIAQIARMSDRSQVPAIAEAFRDLSSAMAAGVIKDPRELQEKTIEILTDKGDAWQEFRKQLSQQLKAQGYSDKESVEWSKAWAEIASGMEGK